MNSKKISVFVWATALVVLVVCYFLLCQNNLNRCLWGNSNLATRTTFHFFSAILVISFFLFFVSGNVVRKWLWFTFAWFLLSILWIANAPTYDSGFFSMMNFTKEKVSVLMSALFVPISLGILLFASWKERKSRST